MKANQSRRIKTLANARRGPMEVANAKRNGGFKQLPAMTEERIRYFILTRFNPIRGLTPQVLVRRLDDFNTGDLREVMMTWDAIGRRDHQIKTVSSKRFSAAARQPWQIAMTENAEAHEMEAKAQKKVLEYFYNNLTATQALERDVRGGVRQLVTQTMHAVGMKYSVHETIWKPSPDGITAEMIQVPNWFFERRTGKLRFLEEDFAIQGVDMERGGWSVAVHDGIMEATSVCFILKSMPLKDWASYCENHASKGIWGKTNQSPESENYQALEDALSKISAGMVGIINTEDEIEQMKFAADGQLPYEPLVERMDRGISALWRGNDLSTMSARGNNDGAGASIQGDETEELTGDDCAYISEVFQQNYDKLVLEWAFGRDVEVYAYFSLGGAKKIDVDTELKVDKFLSQLGVPMGLKDTLERYGRSEPPEDAELIQGGGQQQGQLDFGFGGNPYQQRGMNPSGYFNNEVMTKTELARLAKQMAGVQRKQLQPVALRITKLLDIANEHEFRQALQQFRNDLPDYLMRINAHPESARLFAEMLKESFIAGQRDRSK